MVEYTMEDVLKKTVSEFFDVDPSQIDLSFPLSGRRIQGSLARARLDAAIRHRLGIKCQAVYSAKTYGELESAVLGTASIPSHPSVNSVAGEKRNGDPGPLLIQHTSSAFNSVLGCGIDIEMVEKFPEVQDFWNDEFYSTCFTSLEIAYCLLQENPRMHFAARWCAKEALKKCQTSFMHEELKDLELVSNEASPPVLRHYVNGNPTTLPVAVSISHTPQMATAIVVSQRNPA